MSKQRSFHGTWFMVLGLVIVIGLLSFDKTHDWGVALGISWVFFGVFSPFLKPDWYALSEYEEYVIYRQVFEDDPGDDR